MTTKQLVAAIDRMGPQFHEMAQSIESYLNMPVDSACRIVNAGAMNPGKSTLLNAITGKDGLFKAADVRQTVVTQKEQWGQDVYLYDTPGCSSAVLKDDDESYAAFRESDLIMFVHNLMNGGLTLAELKILTGIREIYGAEDFSSRVCVVGTRSDECDENEIQRNMAEVAQLINDNLGATLKSFVVSPKLHLEGLQLKASGNGEDAKCLIREGGVESLKRYLRSQVKRLGKRSNSRMALYVHCLEQLAESVKVEKSKAQLALTLERRQARMSWNSALSNIKPAWQECK